MRPGRKSTFTMEVAREICEQIANGKSLVTILKQPGMPTYNNVMDWLNKYQEFAKMYAKAKEEQVDHFEEELTALCDEIPEDKLQLAHRRLQIDTRKFIMAKLKPHKYGERMLNENRYTDKDGNDIAVNIHIGTKPGE